jgi:RHS repeat-associated protein
MNNRRRSFSVARCGSISVFVIFCLLCSAFSAALVRRTSASSSIDDRLRLGSNPGGRGGGSPTFPQNLQGPAFRKGELLVRFRAGVSQLNKDLVIAAHSTRRKKQLRGDSAIEKLELTGTDEVGLVNAALQLSLNPAVEFAEPNFLIAHDQINPQTPNDPRFTEQWALNNTGQNGGQYSSDIGVTRAWQTTTGAPATVIAIIDSGIDFTHPDLANNEWTNPLPLNGDVHGWDYVTDKAEIKDEQGHGTAVAGIIAAQGNNAEGISGVMWRASLMSLRVLDNTGSGDVANAVEAIDYAVAHGAQVINLSWGTSGQSVALKDAIQRALRRGVVVVCSAGNNGQDIQAAPYYPASFGLKDLIAVAGTDNSDRLASWSNWGAGKITIAAPGTNILTTQKGGGYWIVSGTSASAPIVSGIAGLIKSVRPLIDPHALVKAISDGARPIDLLSGKVSSGGVANANGALDQLHGPNNGPLPLPTPAYGNGGNPSAGPYVPPALTPDESGRRAHGKDGLRADPPQTKTGAPAADLPDLNQSRRTRQSPKTSSPSASIQSNLMCADCDPGGGGGAGGSDPYFATARTRPVNETGGTGVTLGSRNFNWSVPLVTLPGRAGMDLSISLFYNSLVWTQQGSAIQYNADHGTPAPGFQIGLPRLQTQYLNTDANAYAYIMITPEGGRVEMRQVGSSNVYESADSSYTQLTFSGSTPVVRTTDGTQYVFATAVAGERRCTTIEDRNGNYISATYDANNGHVLTITDTLSRTINFGYDGDGNLYNITQTWGGVTHWWAVFIYGSAYMSFNFSGLTAVGASNGGYQTVLSYVALSDNTSYHFDYNSYGQVYQIRHKAPDGHELEHTFYNIDTSSAQTDCPRFTDSRYYAQDWNGNAEAITYYSVVNGATWITPETGAQQSGTLVQQTDPDGTIYREYAHASGWDTGLTQLSESWSGGVRKKWLSSTWTQDNTGLSYQQNPRLIETNVYDDGGNRRRTTVEYNWAYGLPTHIREYSGADGQTFLRFTAIGYKQDAQYVDRRLIGLPYERVVYDGQSGHIVSRQIYHYDWGDPYTTAQTPSTNYDSANYPASFISGRGNLVAIARYNCSDDTAAYDDNQAVWLQLNHYNLAGSKIWSEDNNWHHTEISYGDNFSDGNNGRNTLAYPTVITDPDGYSSTLQYNYDFGGTTRTHVPTSGTGGGITYLDMVRQYDAYGRPEQTTNQTTGAYTRIVYETNANYVHTYQTLIDLTQANEFHSWQVMDGAGRVRAAASDHPGSSGGYQGLYLIYDVMGRVSQQSNPTEMNGSWSPVGDDSAWHVITQLYDWNGRATQTTNSDGTTRVTSYGGCGCAGGEVTTVQDEHGRQRRLTRDALGRLATTQELNWDTSVYATTAYSYNARDQLTQINQAGQIRSFAYDGHGRLQSRTTPEQGTTTYSYNVDDTISGITDARGATTTLTYNGRHRITSYTYGANGGAASTPNASFGYDAAGNRTSMSDGLGSVSYIYNNLAQLTSETRTFNSVGSYTLTYGYNLAGELNSVTNPWGAQVGYGFDKAGRLTNVSGSGYAGVSNYASSLTYRAFGALKGMTFGNGQTLGTAYDNRLRPTTWNVSNVLGYNYNYDFFNEHTGRATYAGSIYDSSLDRSYEYDNVGRLATSHSGAEARAAAWTGQWGTMDGPYSQGYDYDVWGNVTHKYGWGGEVQGGGAGQSSDIYASFTNNRRDGFSYDNAGNLTFDLGQTFTYDVNGQQASASYGGYSLQQYYDGDGLRVQKSENGAATYYLRSSVLGGQVVGEIIWASVSWQWSRGYVYGGSNLLAVQQNGVYWMHEDPVTKSKRVTDSNGNIVSYVELDPWGADTNRSSNGAFQPHRYTTYERDGNQSDEAMFRRYNRWHSRFDQPDPYDGSYNLTDPQSFNRYAYVQNDPVNFVDPTGLMPMMCGLFYEGDGRYGFVCFGDSNPFFGFNPKMGGGGPRPVTPQQRQTADECRNNALNKLAEELNARKELYQGDLSKAASLVLGGRSGAMAGAGLLGPGGAIIGGAIGVAVAGMGNDAYDANLESGPVNRFNQAAKKCDKIKKSEQAAANRNGPSMQASLPQQFVVTRQFGTFALRSYIVVRGPTSLGDLLYEHHGPNPTDPVTNTFGKP